jgi:hypothetical protein
VPGKRWVCLGPCRRTLPVRAFAPNRHGNPGSRCRPCLRAGVRADNAAHRPKRLAYQARYRRTHRAQLAAADKRRRDAQPKSGRRRFWTPADLAVLVARYPHESTAAIARDLGRGVGHVYQRAAKAGLKKTAAYLASPDACRLRRGDNVGAAFRYPKGHVPANKGTRRPGWAPGRMKETQFRKGQPGWNWRPIGSQRLVDGYLYTKVSDERCVPWTQNWKQTHVLLWEKHRGPIPAGHAVAFRNRDRRDVRLDNLEIITRRELMLRNSVHNLPQPLPQVVQLLGALRRQIRKRTKGYGQEQDRRPA